jgi:hypothetical protein
VREQYEQKFLAHQQSLATAAKSWGWRFAAADTSQRPEDVLNKMYHDLSVKK